MTVHGKRLRYFSLSKNSRKKSESDDVGIFYDKLIYLVVILAPIANMPQLLKIWVGKDAAGVSAVSWFFFSAMSVMWFFYGILHKDKHILFMNVALMVIQLFIAIGAVVYG